MMRFIGYLLIILLVAYATGVRIHTEKPYLTFRKQDSILSWFQKSRQTRPLPKKPSASASQDSSFFPSPSSGILAAQRVRDQAEKLRT